MGLKAVLVPGTWGWDGTSGEGDWWWPTSPFVAHLEGHGIEVVGKHRPFVWSTDLNGLLPGREAMDWKAGGAALLNYCVPSLCEDRRIPADELILISHSHGGAVCAYAMQYGLKVNTLVTMSTPVRRETNKVWQDVRDRGNLGYWLHVYADGWSDKIQVLGSLFDGRFGIYRRMKLADVNMGIPGAGHSGILHDREYRLYWDVIVDTIWAQQKGH